jgi:hypothetical protein
MRDTRVGEELWFEWSGNGYFSEYDSDLVYCTIGHVDVDNELVRRALASVLQRDGISDSLGDGFKLIEEKVIRIGWAGVLPDDKEYAYCDEDGETEYGDQVENIESFTWIEF